MEEAGIRSRRYGPPGLAPPAIVDDPPGMAPPDSGNPLPTISIPNDDIPSELAPEPAPKNDDAVVMGDPQDDPAPEPAPTNDDAVVMDDPQDDPLLIPRLRQAAVLKESKTHAWARFATKMLMHRRRAARIQAAILRNWQAS